MKLLTLNFLTCAIKTCKTSPHSFPLHLKDCTLEKTDVAFQPSFVRNILPRLNYDAISSVCQELGVGAMLPAREEVDGVIERAQAQTETEGEDEAVEEGKEEEMLKRLHTLLLETSVSEGKLVCGHCGFEYPVKEGVGNFLLPSHLV